VLEYDVVPNQLYAEYRRGLSSSLVIIIGKKLLSLKSVVMTRGSYNRARLIKQQKSFQGLAMYGHELFDVLTKGSKVIRDTLFD
jgi:hypothetical protein